MKVALLQFVILVSATAFVLIYAWFVRPASPASGLLYGPLFRIGTGISMGYATYGVQPIPYPPALGWFLGTVVEGTLGGWIAGLILEGGGGSAAH